MLLLQEAGQEAEPSRWRRITTSASAISTVISSSGPNTMHKVLAERFEDLPRLGGPALGGQLHPDVVPQLHGLLAHVAADSPHDVQHGLERGQRVGDLAEFGAATGRLGAGLLAGRPGDTGVGVGEGVELGQGGPVVTA